MSPGLTPRKSNEPDPCENDFSRTSLNFFSFYASRFGVFVARTSKHATRNAQHDGGGPKVLGINVKLITMYSYYHRRSVSVSSRNYNLMKIMTRRQLNGLGTGLGRVRSSCRREHISAGPCHSGTRLVRPFSMARRNYESSEGAPGPDAGVLTAAVHDEVSRSRFLERRASSRFAREKRASSSSCLAANGDAGEKKREDAGLSS